MSPQPPNYPLPGTARAKLAFALGAAFFAFAFIQRVAPTVMTTELMRDFAIAGTTLGLLSGFYFFAYAAMQLPVGILTDRFGPRKLMSIAALICAIATLGFATSQSLLGAAFWRAIIGGTVAFAFVGSLAIAGYWFKHTQHAMLAGLLQSAGMLGAVLTQAPLRLAVEAFGWRHVVAALGVVALLLAVSIFCLLPKQRVAPRTSRHFAGLTQTIANPHTWLCAIIGFGLCGPMLAFSGLWATPWLNSIHGYSPTQAVGLASILFLGWASMSPLIGWCSDFIGYRKPLLWLPTVLYFALFYLIIFHTPTHAAPLAGLLFATGACGACVTLGFVMVKELNPPQYDSTALGLMNMFVVGSGAVMQPLIGFLLDAQWAGDYQGGVPLYTAAAYQWAFCSLLVIIAIALLGIWFLPETRCQPRAAATPIRPPNERPI